MARSGCLYGHRSAQSVGPEVPVVGLQGMITMQSIVGDFICAELGLKKGKGFQRLFVTTGQRIITAPEPEVAGKTIVVSSIAEAGVPGKRLKTDLHGVVIVNGKTAGHKRMREPRMVVANRRLEPLPTDGA